jgi:hypothetical protein
MYNETLVLMFHTNESKKKTLKLTLRNVQETKDLKKRISERNVINITLR